MTCTITYKLVIDQVYLHYSGAKVKLYVCVCVHVRLCVCVHVWKTDQAFFCCHR